MRSMRILADIVKRGDRRRRVPRHRSARRRSHAPLGALRARRVGREARTDSLHARSVRQPGARSARGLLSARDRPSSSAYRITRAHMTTSMTPALAFSFVLAPARLGRNRSRAGLRHHAPAHPGRRRSPRRAPERVRDSRRAIAPSRRTRASRRAARICCRRSRVTRRRMAARSTPRRSASRSPASIPRAR